MKHLIKYIVVKTLLVTGVLVLCTYAKVASQSLSLMGGNHCVGQPHSFWLSGGSGCSVRWEVHAVGDYQIIEQSNERIVVSWPVPDQANAVIAYYVCGGQSGSFGVSVPIYAYVTPTVSLSADPNSAVAGTPIKFTASATNQGSSPDYYWYVNNAQVAKGISNTYTPTNLNNNDKVKVVLDSSYPCVNTDGISSNEIQVTINHYPAVNAGTDQTLAGAKSVTLTGTASDPWGTISSVSWTKVSGPAATLSGQNTLTLAASNLVKGVYVFRLTATDNTGLTKSDDVRITIAAPLNNYNWIKETTVLVEGKKAEAEITSLTAQEKGITWNYFDGLGRSMQSVQVQASPQQKDIVQPVIYDEFGREKYKYLPYVSTETSGYYKVNPVGTDAATYPSSPQAKFYSSPGEAVAYSTKPYSETVFEQSPLNRVLKQGAPGETWQPNADPALDRSIQLHYETNGENEVILFSYNSATGLIGSGTAGALRYYDPNQLYVKRTMDEHDNAVIEYTDKEGRTVCKKVEYEKANDVKKYASTYYIYDDFGTLVVVLPPEAINNLPQN
jgi:hypothetical protein